MSFSEGCIRLTLQLSREKKVYAGEDSCRTKDFFNSNINLLREIYIQNWIFLYKSHTLPKCRLRLYMFCTDWNRNREKSLKKLTFVRKILNIWWWQFGNQGIEWLPNCRYQIVVTKLSLDILVTNNLVTIQFLGYQIIVTKLLLPKYKLPKC